MTSLRDIGKKHANNGVTSRSSSSKDNDEANLLGGVSSALMSSNSDVSNALSESQDEMREIADEKKTKDQRFEEISNMNYWTNQGVNSDKIVGKKVVRFERMLSEDKWLINMAEREFTPTCLISDEGTLMTATIGINDYESLNNGDLVVYGGRETPDVMGVVERFAPVRYIPQDTFDDIGGLENQITDIKDKLDIFFKDFESNKESIENLNARPPKGMLFYGDPGTGKTLLAKAVANYMDASFYAVNGAKLVKGILGQSANELRQLFEQARKTAPSVVFIDEITGIIKNREYHDGVGGAKEETNRLTEELQVQMDGLCDVDYEPGKYVMVIATTNMHGANFMNQMNLEGFLDNAVLSRFGEKMCIGTPDPDAQMKILDIKLKGLPISEEMNKEKVLYSVRNFYAGNPSGRDIDNIVQDVKTSILVRLRSGEIDGNYKLTHNDFDYVIKRKLGHQQGYHMNGEKVELGTK
jgi:ATP-dependent 26S proteasome regulatory subunit